MAQEQFSVLKIDLSIRGTQYQLDLALDATVHTVESDPEGLSHALADQPARFANWAVMEGEARAAAKTAEIDRARMYAELYTRFEQLPIVADVAKGRKKPTVDKIKSMIAMEPEYQRAQRAVVEAERALDLLIAGRQTMQQKKDVLMALASNYRAELDAHQYNALNALREKAKAHATRQRPVAWGHNAV